MPMAINKNSTALAVFLLSVFVSFDMQAYAARIGVMPAVACPQMAKRCPDGSVVQATGPNCEFPSCPQAGNEKPFVCPPNAICASPIQPGPETDVIQPDNPPSGAEDGTGSGSDAVPPLEENNVIEGSESGVTGTATVGPGVIVNADDMSLIKYPDYPLSAPPKGPQTVRFIIEHRSALNGKHVTIYGTVVEAVKGGCPGNPHMGMPCMMTRIVIADDGSADRNQRYDLMIALPSEGFSYQVGQSVQISGTVSGSKEAASLTRD
jgi:hypothetical protein